MLDYHRGMTARSASGRNKLEELQHNVGKWKSAEPEKLPEQFYAC